MNHRKEYLRWTVIRVPLDELKACREPRTGQRRGTLAFARIVREPRHDIPFLTLLKS